MVADADDRALPVGETGEILCRGDMVMPGYWRNPDASAQTLKGGWLHTGDVGAFDADGYLTLKDRSKDLIISGGSNIYPREVEEVLLRARRGARGLGDRPARPRMGRGGGRLRGRRGERGRARRALPRPYRPLQAAEGLRVRRRACRRTITARSSRPSCASAMRRESRGRVGNGAKTCAAVGPRCRAPLPTSQR